LAGGIMVADTVRCPWHHACFSLRTGAAVRAPALAPVTCWKVETTGRKLFVREKESAKKPQPAYSGTSPKRVVIVGGGAAGEAAAETLRREGYRGHLTIISADDNVPYDRPALSKDFLNGAASKKLLPLHASDFYRRHEIDLMLNTRVAAIDARNKTLQLVKGGRRKFDALLLATGAAPVKLDIPGASLPHVCYLRTRADCNAIIAKAAKLKRVVLIGASFIAMEVASSLVQRKLEVHIVAPEAIPMERVLGPEVGTYLHRLHESKGVVFHLQQSVVAIDERKVTLKDGGTIEAGLVVIGVGAKPLTELAEHAGVETDRGVLVDEYLETSAPGIFAAGDIARWPDPHSGNAIRVEHWVVAERQGQTAALNMLGQREAFTQVPFFWSQHYDIPINYVGHCEGWDELIVEGDIAAKDCLLRFKLKGKVMAVASIFRDLESLQAEAAMEQVTA
jgi:NADPH-dependent 2,4-dienoyl-CoA reductase/sulfur reductase-like enzyme